MAFSFQNSFGFAGRGLSFAGVFGFDERFQVVETRCPEHAVLLDPGVDGAQRLWIQLINPVTPLPMFSDQVRAAKQAQVFRDGRPRDGERAGDLTGRLASPAQEIEDGAPGGIGQSLERHLLVPRS